MFVLKHKTKDLFIYKGFLEMELRDSKTCTKFKTLCVADKCLKSERTKEFLELYEEEVPSNFEIYPADETN